MNEEEEEIKIKIKGTEADIAEAKREGNSARRDRLEAYLLELQKEKVLLLQKAQEASSKGIIYMGLGAGIGLHNFPYFFFCF